MTFFWRLFHKETKSALIRVAKSGDLQEQWANTEVCLSTKTILPRSWVNPVASWQFKSMLQERWQFFIFGYSKNFIDIYSWKTLQSKRLLLFFDIWNLHENNSSSIYYFLWLLRTFFLESLWEKTYYQLDNNIDLSNSSPKKFIWEKEKKQKEK